MGKRREPRKAVALQVRIFGTDVAGRIFSETVTTLDISQTGARLGGVRASMKVNEIIGVSYGRNKVHFPSSGLELPPRLAKARLACRT